MISVTIEIFFSYCLYLNFFYTKLLFFHLFLFLSPLFIKLTQTAETIKVAFSV